MRILFQFQKNLVILLLILTSCTTTMQQPTLISTMQKPPVLVHTPTETIIPTYTPTPIQLSTSTPTPVVWVSPLQEIALQDLPATIYNPFHLPKAGSDDPHQGVDFSEVDPQSRITLEGMAVQSILAGRVVQVMEDRFPYGNAVLVVSGPAEIPLNWLTAINKMETPSPWRANPALSCPQGWEDAPEQSEQIHLFVLYAHLKNATDVQVEDGILAGQVLGEIGMSGNALAPHLHVEIRYAYSEAIPDSMAHYDVSATAPEMMQYCRWRVSGWYRPLDPMSLLLLTGD
ncbi:MAG: hypothetical protein CVU39_19955 [Chloroflexi bacterium HGW-Chloroflexi-10]|nr:MAG: hypothetical protein CVU39_19955 [Chloroflexi bacterium HGW-Chloroflexi-10]